MPTGFTRVRRGVARRQARPDRVCADLRRPDQLPHLHVLAADGAFLPNGCFVVLPRLQASLLAEGFRREGLAFLAKSNGLSEELRTRMLAWRHGGFSAHNEVSVAAEDAEGRKKLAGCSSASLAATQLGYKLVFAEASL